MALALACCSALLLAPAAARAANIAVTTTGDVSAEDDLCSLREAINAATTNTAVNPGGAGDDCPAGGAGQTDFVQLQAATYTISGAANENANASGDLDLTSASNMAGALVIDGLLGAGDVPLSTIDAASQDRIFDVQSEGAAGTIALEIRDVILRNGAPPGVASDGGAIRIGDDDSQFDLTNSRVLDSDATHYGGGLHFENGANGSDVNITQTEFAGNTAGDEGGALWLEDNENEIDVVRSSFIGNSAEMGGAIYEGSVTVQGQLFVTNSTFSGNTAADAGGAFSFAADVGGNVYFNFVTMSGNSTLAAGAGGGIFTSAANQFVLINASILAGNTAAGVASNCAGPSDFPNNASRSIESANTCGMTALQNNLVNTNPLLAPLAFNAGGDQTTRTQGLFDTSPALNNILTGNCAAAAGFDQRGIVRPQGGACDVGAFEGSVGPAPVTLPAVPAEPAPVPAKKCKKKKKGKKGAVAAKKKCKKKKKRK